MLNQFTHAVKLVAVAACLGAALGATAQSATNGQSASDSSSTPQTSQAVVGVTQGEKVFLSIDASKLKMELNELFESTNTSSNLTWGQVLSNGSDPGMDLDFNAYNLAGVNNLTAAGTVVADSLRIAKVISGEVSSLANHTTTQLSEGDNLYFTPARARGALSDTLAYFNAVLDSFQLVMVQYENSLQALLSGNNPNPSTFAVCGDTLAYAGYGYPTIEIGGECWFAENLQTKVYASGDTIPEVVLTPEWAGATSGARVAYENDEEYNKPIFGYLYNWYAVNNSAGLCPSGWHVPTDEEWSALVDSLGGSAVAGDQLKAHSNATPGWDSPANTGFGALPGGGRTEAASYVNSYDRAYFWSSTLNGADAWSRELATATATVGRLSYSKAHGFSVRCLKDADPILGCTDPAYQEYNAEATQDDGSCATLVAAEPVFSTCGDTLAYQGYHYPTVEIVGECWFQTELRSEVYLNGDSILTTASDTDWINATVGYQTLNPNLPSTRGRIYNGYAAFDERGVCPSGWHIPTSAQWEALRASDGGNVATKKATSSDSIPWNGTNTSGFSAVPTGYRQANNAVFYNSTDMALFWSTPADGYEVMRIYAANMLTADVATAGFSIRCIQSSAVLGCTDPAYQEYNAEATQDDGSCATLVAAEPAFNCTDFLSYAGHDYLTVEINGDCWFAENLRTETFANGDSIPGGLTNSEWVNTGSAAQAINSNLNDLNTYGRLYNAHAVSDPSGLCPTGWHVPTHDEFTALTDFLGGISVAGKKMKAAPTDSPSWDGSATEASGFAALPAGGRNPYTGLPTYSGYGVFWSSTESTNGDLYIRELQTGFDDVRPLSKLDGFGLSVRCIQD